MSVLWGHERPHGDGDEEDWHYDAGGVERGHRCLVCDHVLEYPYVWTRCDTEEVRFHPLCALQWASLLMSQARDALAGFEATQSELARRLRGQEAVRQAQRKQAIAFWESLGWSPGFSFNYAYDWVRHDLHLDRAKGMRSFIEAETQGLIRLLEQAGSVVAHTSEYWKRSPVSPSGGEQIRPEKTEGRIRVDPQRSFSGAQKKELYLRANGHCIGCGQPLDSDWHADHIVPHSRGGKTEVVNGQALCQPCNSRKRAKVLTVDGEEG